MSESREQAVTRIFVLLASSLANGYDVVDLLDQLTTECATVLDVASAGLLLADTRGVLHVMAASSERTRNLELLQLQRDQGPCLDCYHRGEPVSVTDLSAEVARWPQFVAAALSAGFASVHALPMRMQDSTLGTLGLFGIHAGALNAEDLGLAQAFAEVASVAIVQSKALTDTHAVNQQLQLALTSRVVLEQAKGVLAQRGQLEMDEAFAVLRDYSRDHNRRLTDVARAVVERQLQAAELLRHAATRADSRGMSKHRPG